MRRFFILTKALFLMHLRNGTVLFWNFAFPLLLMVIYGQMSSGFGDNGTPGQAMAYLTPGVIVLNALSFGLVSSSTMMLEMREKGVLRRLQVTSLPALHLIEAYLLVNLVLGVLQSALILLAGVLLYDLPFDSVGLLLGLPMILIGTLTFLTLGGIISGIAPKAGAATAAGMTVYFGLMFISDMIMPLEFMPEWIQTLAPYLPSYLVVTLLRAPLLDGVLDPQTVPHLLLLAAYGAGAALLAGRLFRWEPRA